jgi:hypothetical protein
MKLYCSQQGKVAAALQEKRWPKACDPALHAHVAQCQICNDLVLVTQVLQQARREMVQEADLRPSPASAETLWWRSELRQRNRAVERMTRPIAITEKLALVGLALVVVSLAVWQWNQIADWLFSLTNAFGVDGTSAADMTSWMPILLMTSLGAFVVVWGLTLFLSAERD